MSLRAKLAWVAGLAAAFACGPVQAPAGSPAPLNACSTPTGCQAFASADGGVAQPGAPPSCSGGQCVVASYIPQSWLAVISTATDSYYAPGMTWALPFSNLLASPASPASDEPGSAQCADGACVQIPSAVAAQGLVSCQASTAAFADFYLGTEAEVDLPVQATFTPQWASSAAATPVDATTVGLPLLPVVATTIQSTSPEPYPGPYGGPSLVYTVPEGLPPLTFPATGYPSLVYQRTLMPLDPFQGAYPPDVNEDPSPTSDESVTTTFDTTSNNDGSYLFTLSRADGQSLAGWSGYLRDATTLRRLSNLPPLTGAPAQFLTSHHTMPLHELDNTQLVMVPPVGEVLPTWIFVAVSGELGPGIPYPALPPPVQAAGQVTSAGGPADLVFEAIDLCRFGSSETPQHDIPTSMSPDFEFTARTATDDKGFYAVTLPLGNYQLTVVPHDPSEALTVVSPFVLADSLCRPVAAQTVPISPAQKVKGMASVYDGRPLAGATVEAIPAACASPPPDPLPAYDPVCMPRFAQAFTADDGTYVLTLDPGSYTLRVRPAEGSGFPWVVQPLSVTAGSSAAPPTYVPAPLTLTGLSLYDPTGNPLVEALVQVFELPSSGPPYVQIGDAITDAQGHYDMYLAPPAE